MCLEMYVCMYYIQKEMFVIYYNVLNTYSKKKSIDLLG